MIDMSCNVNISSFRISFVSVLLCCVFCLAVSAQGNKYKDSYNYCLGVEALRNDNHSAALEYFNKEVEQHKDNASAYLFIAEIYYLNDDYGPALSNVEYAIKYAGRKDKLTASSACCLRANIYSDLGKDDLALKDYNQAIKMIPDDADFYEKRAQFYFEREMYDLADEDYLQMQKLDPGGVMSYMGLGRNNIARKEYEKAIEQFDYVTKLYPNYSSALSFRAEAYAGLKKWKKFADDVIGAISIDLDSKAFSLMQEKADTAYVFLSTKLKAKATMEPNRACWPYYLGALNECAGKYEEAIGFYGKSMEKDPDDITAGRLSFCYQEIGDCNQAISYMDKAIEMDSTNVGYHIVRAYEEYEAGKVADAIADLDYYIAKDSENARAFYLRGFFKDCCGDTEEALDDYTTAIVIDPEYVEPRVERGVLYRKLGRTDEAEADFEKALQLDTLAEENTSRHYALFYLGKEEEAFEWIRAMVEKGGKYNYYNAACLYSLAGKTEEAVEYLRKSFEAGFRRFSMVMVDRELADVRELASFKALMDEYMAKQVQENVGDAADYVEKVVEIPFTRSGGVTKVKCSINGLPLSFIFDTGASSVSISSLEATFMYKNDYLTDKDIVGRAAYVDANGDISVGTVINIKSVTFGGLELNDVNASVVSNDKAPLLLGQSVLSRLGKIEIDYERNVLKITVKEALNK